MVSFTTRRVRFEVAFFESAGGTIAPSLGRQPQVFPDKHHRSPEGATAINHSGNVSPLRGFAEMRYSISWG
ncbi:hypothetical protein LF1_16030 [Rubripirellula obstinata]|uniref:Uncharacterized protein n=1 Tax=Rubripirellula obstinata TaxID=406547 RepID=A0A5B1CET8_9BACT|nr:hypothetical protein LF1_16030 [Rubripirellula obstinata]